MLSVASFAAAVFLVKTTAVPSPLTSNKAATALSSAKASRAFCATTAAESLKATATLTAFGMTRRVGRSAENDDVLAAVLNAGTPAVCLVGKTHPFHVREALGGKLQALEIKLTEIKLLVDILRSTLGTPDGQSSELGCNLMETLLHEAARLPSFSEPRI